MSSIRSLFRRRRYPLVRTSIAVAGALVFALLATDLPVRGVSADIVISQVYGGGGNAGATLKNDFVELFNRGSAAVNLSGKSIQYASATGTGNFASNPIVALSGTLQPGQYYLVQLAGGANGVALPTADATGTVNMSGTGGKVALVSSTAGLACNGGSTPCSAAQLAQIIDLVGWDGANFFEGTAAPATTNATAVIRAGGGCTDTDNNASDFSVAAPAPRNSSSTFHACGGPTPPTGIGLATPASLPAGDPTVLTVTVTPGANPTSTGLSVGSDLSAIGGSATQAFYDDGTNGDVTAGDSVFSYSTTVSTGTAPGSKSLPFTVTDAETRNGIGSISLTVTPPLTAIHDIQGPGLRSPYEGWLVKTSGIVTARRYNNGFFIQTPDGSTDSDPNTSEGIFVYTGSAPPIVAAVGAYVEVSGTVSEYAADPYAPPMTEIGSPIVALAAGGSFSLPAPVTLTTGDLSPTGTLDQLEWCEGMRVTVPALRVVSPTDGSVNEPNAISSSNGVFYAVIDGTARPFREPGVQVGVLLPAGAPPNVPRFDFNPERLRVDSDGQVGAAKIEVATGALLSDVVGVLDYGYYTWTILPDPSASPVVSPGPEATAVPVPDVNEFTVASFNLERFFDTVDDPTISDAVLKITAFANRLNKASLAIRTMGQYPDILGVQEVENLTTLQALASKINDDAVAAGAPNPYYAAYLEEGNDPGGIDVGFLVRTDRVVVHDVVQEGKDATYVEPSGVVSLLNDRPPLVLTANVTGPTGTLPVTVIVNHLRSLSDVDNLTDGRVRAKRLAQAEFLANLIQDRQIADPHERIVSVGDYNAYEVNDGYVDVMGVIRGAPAPADQDVLAGPALLVNPTLTDLVTTLPAEQRYSYSYDGSAQVLDHILVNERAGQRFSRMQFARFDADFPESYRDDPDRPERVSDHDMAVAYFVFPAAPILRLNGANPMTVELGGTYVDPGATATDGDWGDISSLIEVSGTVDPNTLGTYPVTYTVSNGYATSTIVRMVEVVDTTPPVMSLVVPTTTVLWPANHKFVTVGLGYTANDISGAVTCLVGVASSESVNGTGDGNTSTDWLVTSATSVLLRAERAGTGTGRVYTLTVTCRDGSGNATVGSTTVIVPKSQGK